MKRLEQMKECLVGCVQNQINGHLDQVDAKELGEAIDMIKDLEEAIYYATITKAMKDEDEDKQKSHHQQQQPMYYPPQNDMMYNNGSMYNRGGSMYNNGYNGNSGGNNSRGGGSRGYSNIPMGEEYERDYREGSSPMYRRMYMESKEMGQDNVKNMQDFENYMHELSNDIMEMIGQATPEEKQMLRQKITALATKIK